MTLTGFAICLLFLFSAVHFLKWRDKRPNKRTITIESARIIPEPIGETKSITILYENGVKEIFTQDSESVEIVYPEKNQQ